MNRSTVLPRQKSLALPEIGNPFELKLELSCIKKLQVLVMSITLAPIRLLILIIILLMIWVVAALGIACLSEEDKQKPFSGWRLSLQKPFVALGRAMCFVLGFYKIRIKGKRAPTHVAPVLVAAPHSSFFDAILFFLDTPLASPVSRSENAELLLFGKLIKYAQPVLVKRQDPDSRINTIKEIKQRSQSGGEWPQVIIFPEGTCTNRSCLISFKLGAFYCGVPVQPVCIKFPNKLDTITWTWEGPRAFKQLWLTLCQFYTLCEIEYLPVYSPSDEEKTNCRLFADNVRTVMQECLKIPTTDHTFDDCMLMMAAQKMDMPLHAGLVEFEKLHSKLGIKYDDMRKMLDKFNEIKGNKTKKAKVTRFTYEEFSKYLLLPQSESLKQVFDLYDRDGSGTIDFREYVIGMSLVSAPVNNDDTIELAFELFDTDGKGYISQQELQTMLTTAFSVSEENSQKIFREVDSNNDNRITMDEFKNYAKKKPEYAKIFTTYRELKIQEQKRALEKGTCIFDQHASDFEQWGAQVDESTKKLQ